MVALKLILQTLAGVVAVGGAVGGTFALSNNKTTTQKEVQEEKKQQQAETLTLPHSEDYGMRQIKITEVDLDANNETTKAFYLVSADIDISDTLPSKHLFSNTNTTDKNYQCINISQPNQTEKIIKKDISCVLYSLTSTKDKSLKTSEIKSSISNLNTTPKLLIKVIQKTELKHKKFFLLQANNNLIQFEIKNRHPLIYLTTKESTDIHSQTNLYVILKVHAKIFNNEVIGLTDTIIAKAASNPQNSNISSTALSPSYQCSFKSEDQKTDCMLSKLSDYASGETLNFQNKEIKKNYGVTNTETESYYFIKADEIIRHEIQNLKSSTAKYIETNSENSTTTTTLSVEAPVFAKFNNDETKLTELIILD